MDRRFRQLAEQLDAGLIARREFLRKSAVITGGTAVGLGTLRKMAHAQSGTKLRVWLFKSFVTASNDVLAKQIEAWGAERKVQVEMDWATFGDREQKFVAAIEAGNPPDMAEMNALGPMRYKAALRDVSALGKDIANARGGLLPHAEKYVVIGGQYFAVARQTWPGGFFVRKDILDAKGVKLPKVYDPDVVEMAKKCQDPAQDLWGFGQTLNRSDDGNGFMQNILWNYGGSTWDKDGKPALGTTFLKQNLAALQFAVDTIQKYKIQPPGVMGWTDVHNNEAFMAGKLVSTNNGASLYYAMVSKKHPLADKTQVILTPGGPAGSFLAAGCYNWGIFKQSKNDGALRGPDPLGRGREALRRVHEGLDRAGRARLQAARREPVLEERPQHPGHAPERPPRRVAGLSRADHARPPSRCRRSTSCATWPAVW